MPYTHAADIILAEKELAVERKRRENVLLNVYGNELFFRKSRSIYICIQMTRHESVSV